MYYFQFNIFDSLNRLHPVVTKQLKPWNSITMYWLNLFEIYTRYPEGNNAR